MLFGEVIRQQRQRAGLSLANLAAQLGVTKVYVSDVERGLRKPFTQQRIREVAKVLDLDPEELSRLAARSREYVTLPTDGCCKAKVQLAGTLGHVWPSMTAEHAERVQEAIRGSE
jgi:transcriptional regulator with XRE-family HTH domain